MRNNIRWIILGALLIALVVLIVWSYANPSQMLDRASADWSRGLIIGETSLSHAVPIQPAPDGGVYALWANLEGDLELVRIGSNGEVLQDSILLIGRGASRDPQMQVGTDGRLHVIWREEEQPNHTANYALLESDGTAVGQPQTISDPASRVMLDTPILLSDGTGSLHAVWTGEDGIYWVVINGEDTVVDEPVLLLPGGQSPAAQMDTEGQLHLAWRQREDANTFDLRYAVLDPQSGEMGEQEVITRLFIRVGQAFEGLSFGLEEETAYMFWTIRDNRDVSSITQYAFLPLDRSREALVATLPLLRGINPAAVYPLSGQQASLKAVLSEDMGYTQGSSEIALLNLSQGTIPGTQGEEFITESGGASMEPTIVQDSESDYHLTWLEAAGFRRYLVVYASTAVGVRDVYNSLGLRDYVDLVFNGFVEFLSTTVLTIVPMLFLWAVIPTLVIVVYHFATGEERLDLWHSRVILAVVLILEIALTAMYPPSQISSWPPLRWVAPLASAAVAAAGTALALRRSEESRLFTTFFTFTGIHSILQMLIYYFF
jgi:hypothetical protein